MKYILPLLFLALGLSSADAQYSSAVFGKNKVQYETFSWKYLQSEHFDIYFSEGGRGVATFVAQVAEESYKQLRQDFRYELVDRIKIIVYNSHNDFQQTNVDLSPPEESVGGFTEFFKNRVVIPYEGEWEKFRHVIHHELTHAVMLQMVYGAGVQSIITGLTQLQLPLWLVEGLAEYESRGWDIESDMFIRDATLNGYLPDIPFLGGFLAYKGGQSVLKYVADRYGDEKIGELLGKIKINKSMERGLKQSIGVEMEEFSNRWKRYLKRKYWPDIADRDEPEEIGKRLTDHRKDRSFVNTSPSVSNRGDKYAYLSDKDDYFDIYIASAIDGRILKKLVRGQRSGNLEELNWLRGPGISWSPDDKKIVFSAKTGAENALHIVDIKRGNIIESITLGFDGIYNPAWSPGGDEIAFLGIKNGLSDIYSYSLSRKKTRKITSDFFSDVEPRWSPDGTKLVFASDRGPYLGTPPANYSPIDVEMKNYDIYEINSDGTGMRRLTDTPFLERAPIYQPEKGEVIAYTSDRSGVSNIYLKDLVTGEEWPITNVITGAFQPSWGGSGERLIFTSFYFAGYDLYMMKNPLDLGPGDVEVEQTQFVREIAEEQEELAMASEVIDFSAADDETRKYRSFIFNEAFAEGRIEEKQESVFLDSSDYALPTGDFKVHNYKIQFSPDLVYGSVGYNQFFGTQGYAQFLFSDVLGDHRLNIAANLFGDLKNADYALTYLYLPKRLDIGTGLYHNAYYFYSYNIGWVRDRNYGLSLFLSNPFNKYERVSYGLSAMGISRSYLDQPDWLVDEWINRKWLSPRDLYFIVNNLTYTRDNTIWGYTGPANGTRYSVSLSHSPWLWKNGIDFTTIKFDWRRYLRLNQDFSFAVRGAAGASLGAHPQKFFLGGLPNWINYDYYGNLRVDRVEEIYFASFEMPLRGADFYTLEGNRFMMANFEFRFPLFRRVLMGFPLPLDLWNIGGALFTDIGMAWDQDDAFKPLLDDPGGLIQLNDRYAFASIGFGVRIFLGFFLLRTDFAWPTDFYRTVGQPTVLWSLGADF